MLPEAMGEILIRDLRQLHDKIASYPSDEEVWKTAPGIHNPAGTLVLHLVGNLRHFVGATLGKDGYVRDRDAEFARRGVPQAELLAQIDLTIGIVERTLPNLTVDDLERPFPFDLGKKTVPTGEYLMHLASHFGYHLGQVDYHRRLLAGPR